MLKYLLTILFLCSLLHGSHCQTLVFFDDFEGGTSNWTLTGDWGIDTVYSQSGDSSLADSPNGQYQNNMSSTATMVNGVDLSSALDATVDFYAKYDIETGFDYLYVEASTDGVNWNNVATFNGQNNLGSWVNYTYSLGGYVGFTNVKLRFRWFSDAGFTAEGMYIEDISINTFATDNSPPLMIHNPSDHYEATLDSTNIVFDIVDVSGVATAELSYVVDNGTIQTITAFDTVGDTYTFTIPQQLPGAWVSYWVNATDSALVPNSGTSDTSEYISGNYIHYDNGVVSFINSYGPTSNTGNPGTAVRITLGGSTQLVTALIRNYTDINNPNDSMLVHIWDDTNGVPGNDLITPIMVFPEASLLQPNIMTRIDLRSYSNQLSGINGDIWIGYTTPVGETWVVQTTPGTGGRTYSYDGTNWNLLNDDYHFRAITGQVTTPPVADYDYDNSNDPTLVFNDLSSNNTTDWLWDFGDGNTDTVQHPTHTYATIGNYVVCLTASNIAGSDQHCEIVSITNTSPIAEFTYDTILDPTVVFTDASQFNPTSWFWDFDDNGATSTMEDPIHNFSNLGTYNVCLTVSNNVGSDTICKPIIINNAIPIAGFIHTVIDDTIVDFTDQSLNTPTTWQWDFDFMGATDTVQNPSMTYPRTGGTFSVCLTVSNQAGVSSPFCDVVTIEDITIGIEDILDQKSISVYPNPMIDRTTILFGKNVNTGTVSFLMFNILGEQVDCDYILSGNRIELHRNQLPSGIYTFRIDVDGYSSLTGKLTLK